MTKHPEEVVNVLNRRFMEILSPFFLKAAGSTIILILLANSCYSSDLNNGSSGQITITKDQAAQKIIDSVVKNITTKSLRVYQYPNLLDTGTRVRQANIVGNNVSEYLICEHPSWLFFLDLAPGAHFAHPAVISVLDTVNGEIKSIDAQWWPVIEFPVFDTVAERNDPSTIVFEK
jgi:hypothetical protein